MKKKKKWSPIPKTDKALREIQKMMDKKNRKTHTVYYKIPKQSSKKFARAKEEFERKKEITFLFLTRWI